ncbi:MAG TPA: hypothetical protein V6C57_11365 [Coleofasciculaceae cyanobacterium]
MRVRWGILFGHRLVAESADLIWRGRSPKQQICSGAAMQRSPLSALHHCMASIRLQVFKLPRYVS